jgi:hypothetical protein
MSAACISWAELTAGRWARGFIDQPCTSAVLTAGRVWPAWREGSPPTWAEVLACGELSFSDRRWIVARVLLRDRKLFVAWAIDCAELSAPCAGKWEADVRAVLADLRRWCAGETVDLVALRERAWEILRAAAAAAYAAAAAAYAAADADAADAATYTAAAAKCLGLALPYLERAMLVEVSQ